MPSSIYDHIFAFDILLKCTLWYFLVIIYMYLMIFLRRTEWLPQKSSAHSRRYCRIKKTDADFGTLMTDFGTLMTDFGTLMYGFE